MDTNMFQGLRRGFALPRNSTPDWTPACAGTWLTTYEPSSISKIQSISCISSPVPQGIARSLTYPISVNTSHSCAPVYISSSSKEEVESNSRQSIYDRISSPSSAKLTILNSSPSAITNNSLPCISDIINKVPNDGSLSSVQGDAGTPPPPFSPSFAGTGDSTTPNDNIGDNDACDETINGSDLLSPLEPSWSWREAFLPWIGMRTKNKEQTNRRVNTDTENRHLSLLDIINFFPQRSLLFSDNTPPAFNRPLREADNNTNFNDVDESSESTSLEIVKPRLPVPTASIGMQTESTGDDAVISPIGYMAIASLPRDINKFYLDNPELVSLRIIDRISTADCLLVLSTFKRLEHLDVVIDREEQSLIRRVIHTSLRTLRIYTFCDLTESLFHKLWLARKDTTEIVWDTSVPSHERHNCAIAIGGHGQAPN